MSKLLMFDFICRCGQEFEDLIESDKHEIVCPKCSGNAIRQISAVRLDWRRMGLDPSFSSSSDRWAKMQEQKARKEDSQNLVHY